jgi:hypothetical protein
LERNAYPVWDGSFFTDCQFQKIQDKAEIIWLNYVNQTLSTKELLCVRYIFFKKKNKQIFRNQILPMILVCQLFFTIDTVLPSRLRGEKYFYLNVTTTAQRTLSRVLKLPLWVFHTSRLRKFYKEAFQI